MTLNEFCDACGPSEVATVSYAVYYNSEIIYLRDGRRRFMGGYIKGDSRSGIPSVPIEAHWMNPVPGTEVDRAWSEECKRNPPVSTLTFGGLGRV